MATTYNRIVKVTLELELDAQGGDQNLWKVDVTKEFAPEFGGGEQTFTEHAIDVHRALAMARGMVTAHPAYRTEEK